MLTPAEEGNLSLSKVSKKFFKNVTNESIVLGELLLAFLKSLAWKSAYHQVFFNFGLKRER